MSRDEFIRKRGTRREFLLYLVKTVETWLIHRHHVKTFNHNWRLMEHRLMTIPALINIEYPYMPPTHGVCATAVIDFGTCPTARA